MIEPLHDAHTSIEAEAIDRSYECRRPNPHPIGKKDLDRISQIIGTYVPLGLRRACCNRLFFGMLKPKIAYLRITRFRDYTEVFDFDQEIAALNEVLDQWFRGAPAWDGLVIDVRLRNGGSDMHGVTVASRLANERYLAYRVKARNDALDPSRFTAPQEIWVPINQGRRFGGKIVLLTGPDTISAQETFVMALMGRRPEVIRIGDNTQGVFSDELIRKLPNGWQFGLPNEVFMTEAGECFDGRGIPPHIRVPVFEAADLKAGRDPCIEKAIKILSNAK
jgi:C-terminal processing protease CtpA/Prc